MNESVLKIKVDMEKLRKKFPLLLSFVDEAISYDKTDIRSRLPLSLTVHSKEFVPFEKALDSLDEKNLEYVRARLITHTKADGIRFWHQWFEDLYEVLASLYLREELGCKNISFIQEKSSPDLECVDPENNPVFMEVKVINNSDQEYAYLSQDMPEARWLSTLLPAELKRKIISTCNKALAQLWSYKSQANARRIIYLRVNLDTDAWASNIFEKKFDNFIIKLKEIFKEMDTELVVFQNNRSGETK